MKWTVKTVKVETPNTKTIRFIPDKFISFRPGQFFILNVEVDGKIVKRSYSISSSPLRDYYDVTVKLVENGKCSTFLQNMKPGDTLEAKGPFGRFYFAEGCRDDIVLIGAGSGCAPLMSMLRYVTGKALPVNVTWLGSQKGKEMIVFADELTKLNKKSNVQVHHTLTRESGGEFEGRISADIVKQVVPDSSKPVFFICGPPKMVNSVIAILTSLGVGGTKIMYEKY